MINVFENMTIFFASMNFKDKNVLAFLIESYVPKTTLLSTYKYLVHNGEITKIEELPIERKKELVNECRGIRIYFDNKKLIEAARILHTLNEINAQKKN